MKNTPDELFYLIKSLTKQEKRFFRLFYNNNIKHSTYVDLFDIMDSFKVEDQEKLMHFLNKKWGLNRLNDIKKYLKEAILRFLEYYHFDDSVEIEIQRTLHRIFILYNKKQYVLVKKNILRAEKLATENNLQLHLLLVLKWKSRLMVKEDNEKIIANYESEIYTKEIECIELYRNIIVYRKIKSKVDRIIIEGNYGDKSVKAELLFLLKNKYLKDEKLALSFQAKKHYLFALGNIHNMLKNWEKSYDYYLRLISDFEKDQLSATEQMEIYGRLLLAVGELNYKAQLIGIKQKADRLVMEIPIKHQTIHLMGLYAILLNNYVNYLLIRKDIAQAFLAWSDAQDVLNKYGHSKLRSVNYCNGALICFFKGDFHNALVNCNKLLYTEKLDVQELIISIAKKVNIVIHYELGNQQLALDLCKKHVNENRITKNKNSIESRLFLCLRDAVKDSISSDQLKGIFLKFKNKLKSYEENAVIKELNLISWAESKALGRTMIEILKEST